MGVVVAFGGSGTENNREQEMVTLDEYRELQRSLDEVLARQRAFRAQLLRATGEPVTIHTITGASEERILIKIKSLFSVDPDTPNT